MRTLASFLEDLIAPCVMECDDREQMAERDLLFLRAKGPAPYQPRATPWVIHRKDNQSPEGATQLPRRSLSRPFRAQSQPNREPWAVPWAGMFRTVGAEEAQQRDFLTHLWERLKYEGRMMKWSSFSGAFSSFTIHPSSFSLRLPAIIKQEGRV